VLQEGEFERVGDDRTRRVDVRIIAATNRRLEHEVEAGRFRQDLYFRLSVFPLVVPALRERREDIPMLAAHFIERCAARLHLPVRRLTQAHANELLGYPWPGNVRELENVIERSMIVSQGQPLRFDLRPHAPGALRDTRVPSTRTELLEVDRQSIEEALRKSGGKIYGRGGAAELLGMRPTTLSSKIAALGIVRPPNRSQGRP
jgi:transcriptional regulator with GAF, ATPase, and Fis domain